MTSGTGVKLALKTEYSRRAPSRGAGAKLKTSLGGELLFFDADHFEGSTSFVAHREDLLLINPRLGRGAP